MELIPKSLVIGLLMPPPGVPGGTDVSVDKLNRLWAEIAPSRGYTQLQIAPDGSQANFIGVNPEEGVTIQPPLLQVRDAVPLTAEKSAVDIEATLKVIARHLGVSQFFNLGIRHVFHAPIPDNDARAFLLHRVLGKSDADLGELEMGAEGSLWAGLKYFSQQDSSVYTLVIEPLIADMRNLYIDLDAQFPGPVDLDAVTDRAQDARTYVLGPVNRYLDRHLT